MQDTHYEDAWLDGDEAEVPAAVQVEADKAQLKADVANEYAQAHAELDGADKA